MKRVSIFLLCLWVILLSAQPKNEDFQTLIDSFEKEYLQLNISPLRLSYVTNLNAIPSENERIIQTKFFQKYEKFLNEVKADNLSEKEHVTHALLLYEVKLNLERLTLEEQWKSNNYKSGGQRIYDEPMGKEWYAYYLKKWVDQAVTPDWAYQFGLEEIEKVKTNMTRIREEMDMDEATFQKHLSDSTYFLTSNEEIQQKYNDLRTKVRKEAIRYFPDIEKVSPVAIALGTNEAMAIAPAYYNNNTFYYNFFDKAYDKRDMGWIFLHEAIPGHHYQSQLNAHHQSVRNLFWYSGNAEGWAAYIEQYGKELGAYTGPMDAYGQLQWDLIRSVRVALDVALNYYGWTDEQAMHFWNGHIPGEEDIGEREIKRMKRWPAQVITYKYGKHILDELKGDRKTPQELKNFHARVLSYGAIPLSILKTFTQKNQALQYQEYDAKLSTIDNAIHSLYQVISGPKGQERDWEFLRYIFHPEARFIFSGEKKDGSFGAKYVSMDDYIKSSGPYMFENGFYENEMKRETQQFGQIAQVFSSYECFHSEEEEVPFMRGINSIQLMNTGKRWQIMSIYFTQESEDNPIPKKFDKT